MATADAYSLLKAGSLTRTASDPDDLLDNDTGDPGPVISSFGGGSLGGAVTDHAAGTTATAAGGTLTVEGDGGFSFTPVTTFTGPFTFSYRAQNTAGQADALVTLNVQEAPAITSAPGLTLLAGSAAGLPFTIKATGFPTPTLASTGALPAGLSFTDNGDGTATLSGTPSAGGAFPLSITASNGVGADATQAFALVVNVAPSLAGTPAAGLVGSAYSHAFTVGGYPAPTLSVSAGSLPAGITLAGGALSGTPTVAGPSGSITVTAANSVGTNATLTFTLVVNQAPSLSGTPPSGLVGSAYSHTFTVGGYPAPTLSVTAGTLPPGLALAGNVLSGTPSVGGTWSGITVSASNGVGTPATLSFAITITPPPAPTPDTYAVTGNVSISVPVGAGVLVNDTLNGGTLTGVGATAGASGGTAVPGSLTTTQGGTVTIAANGSFTYNPPPGFVGSDAFYYRVGNAAGNATGAVSLTVSNRIWFVNGAAAAGGTGRQTNPYNTLSAGLAAASSGDALFVSAGTYSGNITLKAGVRHIGQSVALGTAALGWAPATHSVLPAVGTAPNVSGTVTLASSAHLNGFRVAPPGGSTGVTDNGVALTSVTVLNTAVMTTNATAVSLVGTSGTITLSRVDATGGAGGIVLTGTQAAFSVTGDGTRNGSGGTIANHTAHNVRLTNAANVTLNSMVLSGATAGGNAETSGCGVKIDTNGSAPTTVVVRASQFSQNAYRAVALHHTSSASTSVSVTNNAMTNDATTGGLTDVDLWYDGGGAQHTFTVSNNTFTGIAGAAAGVNVNSVAIPRSQTVRGRFNNNSVTGVAGGFSSGFLTGVGDNQGSTLVEEFVGNTFTTLGTMAIDVNHGTGNANVHATIRGNTVSSPVVPGTNYLYGIRLVYSATSTPGVQGTMCTSLVSNNIPDFGTAFSLRWRQLGPQSGYTAQLSGFVGSTTTALTGYLQSQNTFGAIQYSPDPPAAPFPSSGFCQTVP